MSKEAVEDREFERLLSAINQATAAPTKKHDLIFNSKGYFSALQASRLIYAQTTPPDKIRALKIIEPVRVDLLLFKINPHTIILLSRHFTYVITIILFLNPT